MYKRLAKSYSYDGTRKLEDIKGIAIHWTSGSFDTAKNNVDFFRYVKYTICRSSLFHR